MRKNSCRRSILVFGYFGLVTNQLDGQTVKTRAIYELLKEKSDCDIHFADTQEFRYSKKSIFRFFKDLSHCNFLVWLPAHNNLKYFFPLIWFASKIFKFKIIYIVIGGWLSTILKSLNWHRQHLNRIDSILVENKLTKEELELNYQYTNICVFLNFRDAFPPPCYRANDNVLKLVFLARINMMKGLDTIAELCQKLPQNVIIDFYGPINEDDEEFFFSQLIEKYSFINYRGTLAPDKINSVLQNYDAMILPTKYYTEGLPGSIIDAYQAGLPVIVTRWKHAEEFVIEGQTGLIVDFNNPVGECVDAIEYLLNNPEPLQTMKRAAYVESRKYTSEGAWDILKTKII